MVGVVIFKNFESGSYEDMTVTCFEGESYADLERSTEFSSYLVSSVTLRIKPIVESSHIATLSEIWQIAREAKNFFCENTHCTVAEFVKTYTDISFRIRSAKCGVYAPVNTKKLFSGKQADIYALCTVFEKKEPLYLSLICDVLNFGMKMLFDSEEEVYGFSGSGIYINTSVFCQNFSETVRFSKNDTISRRHKINLRKINKVSFSPQTNGIPLTPYRIINRYRNLKKDVLSEMSDTFLSRESPLYIQNKLLALPQNERILSPVDMFYEELCDALKIYSFVFEARSHVYYINIKEALCLITVGQKASEETAKEAKALSSNMKLRDKLPNPDYYTSRGKAIWK